MKKLSFAGAMFAMMWGGGAEVLADQPSVDKCLGTFGVIGALPDVCDHLLTERRRAIEERCLSEGFRPGTDSFRLCVVIIDQHRR